MTPPEDEAEFKSLLAWMDDLQPLADYLCWVETKKLLTSAARRRCLGCWSWNPPQTARCLRCDTRIRSLSEPGYEYVE